MYFCHLKPGWSVTFMGLNFPVDSNLHADSPTSVWTGSKKACQSITVETSYDSVCSEHGLL